VRPADPAHARPWNPDWATHKVADAAGAAGVELDIKGGRHYTASQLLAGGFDLRNTAARPPPLSVSAILALAPGC
jgi:integrase